MSQTKIKGKFYPLRHEELLHLNQILTASELSIYLWLKTKNPFEEKLIEADTQEIAQDLGVSRRTVQRALGKLQQENLIDLVFNQFKYRIKSKSASTENKFEMATSRSSDDNKIVSATPGSSPRHSCRSSDTHVAQVTTVSPTSSEIQSEIGFQNPKTKKTYLDFKKTLSESERESFFKFVEKKIQNLSQPVNDLEAWLASKTKINQNRWEVYYQKYQEENKASKIGSNSSSINSEERKTAITRFKAEIRQQKPIKREKDNKHQDEFNRLLDNPNGTIKSIEQLNNQSKQVQKPLGKRIAEGYEQIRDLRVSQYFANTSTSLARGLA